MDLILASASPRRREILEQHGLKPIVVPSDAEETLPPGKTFSPEETAMCLAEQKAQAVAERLRDGQSGRADRGDVAVGEADVAERLRDGQSGGSALVLGVDTIVYKDRVIGKPADEQDALAILRSLRDAAHAVISGVCLIEIGFGEPVGGKRGPDPRASLIMRRKTVFFDVTFVTFGDYSDDEILAYVRANPPYDKSGSYAIQSDWGRHVVRVEGSIENVIGLPWEKIAPCLGENA
jgi:septum formation protein